MRFWCPQVRELESTRNFTLTQITGLKRYALSTLVNKLLDFETPVPFEFLIDGLFLRTTIDDFLTANGISSETTLNVEFVRALIPPVYSTTFEHDDWVSSVDVLSLSPAAGWTNERNMLHTGHERIISGSYDGFLRVWNLDSKLLAMSTSAANGGHASAVKAVKFLSSTKVVSSSSDRTVRIWHYSETDDAHDAHLSPVLEFYGHKSSVDSLAVHAPSSRILSGSADHTICFWSATKSDAPIVSEDLLPSALPYNKRRKLSNPSKSVPQRGPLLHLTGHSNPVSGVIFAPTDPTVAYSTSWDHSIRTWDLPTGTSVDTRNTSHPLLSICAMNGVNLLATGSSARHITMVDPRASATTVAAMTLHGHVNAVVSLCGHPTSAYGLVSASHDGTCRVWDIRSVRQEAGVGFGTGGQVGESMYVIDREKSRSKPRPVAGDGIKVFEVVWDQDLGIVSGGEDRRLQINRTTTR